ncbi:hypothetical protein T310_3415 [Rasamsonia emersonii CBS 393.64]|uniref:Mediator of RNA polymerase II transcription subunit 20 n=1 Tax=Rasamsonia emersonii (strain ATCC 16479 / CBS 393.64 / IMI 116815) TaxID=1408163 RepID=A0A0F4YY51_RASE3|nr:hypothetical protein T310_3415 [Rasamsonia emersonii CBS 393.64]KKA22568.1 hypothetical protein T310_3415 [Rasamsonia emersonii CBS 393.64]
MPITGVFFIPSTPNAPNALATLSERLRSSYGDEAVPVGRWALEHKLMRDTSSCLPASAHAPNPPPQPRYMQFLSLSHYPNHGFIYASESTDQPDTNAPGLAQQPPRKPSTQSGMIMSTIPLPSCSTLFQHFVRACEPLWCHRHTVTAGGTTYDVGDFRVRIGEVRQTQPMARARGTVVEIEWRGPSIASSPLLSPLPTDGDGSGDYADSAVDLSFIPEDSDIDAEYAQTAELIREFWSRFGVTDKGVQEAILVPDVGRELKAKLHQRRQSGWRELEAKRRQKKNEAAALGRSWGWGWNEQDDDPDAGVDLARQYMEIFRFNR